MTTRRAQETDIVRFSRRLHERRWVANHDGNVSARLANGHFLATPTAVSKGDVQASWLVVVDRVGSVVGGSRRIFSEVDLHLFVYRNRPDVGAVIHSHAPAATALAVAGQSVLSTMLAESVVSLGRDIPLVRYARPKSPEAALNLGATIDDADAVTLEGHGVLTWGPDLETAYLRMELVEHLANIQLKALQLGAVRELPEEDILVLLEARTKAGLGQTGRSNNSSQRSVEPAGALRYRRALQ